MFNRFLKQLQVQRKQSISYTNELAFEAIVAECRNIIRLWQNKNRDKGVDSSPVACYLQEFSDADWETGFCRGKLIGFWLLGPNELFSFEPFVKKPPVGAIRDGYYEYGIFKFHVDKSENRILLERYFGSLNGDGLMYEILKSSDAVKLSSGIFRWIS